MLMNMFITIVAFVVAILILVSLHELGHLTVARLMGVKVLRFSVGFGKPFFTIKRRNIEWCLAPIPLGGYVKMVDTREGKVAAADLPYAFDKQHPAKRVAIVLAGPLTNLVLAVLLYAISFSAGVTQIRPWVGTVIPASIAAKAGFQPGDKILAVNQQKVRDWADAHADMVLNLDAGKINVAVEQKDGQHTSRIIDAAGTEQAAAVAKTGDLGLLPFRVINRIGMVEPSGAAQKAGLKKGDVLLAVDGQAVSDWQDWADKIRRSAGQKLAITYARGHQKNQTYLRPDSVVENGEIIGRVGVGAMSDETWDKKIFIRYQPGVGEAFALAGQRTGNYISLTLSFFGKLVTGKASLNYISGPIAIADIAGKTAQLGWQSYVEFLALVSISLGVLNLLPIPVLDGGYLLYYAVEWIRGRPMSEHIQQLGLRFGLAAMLMLMVVAFFNDITRLLG